MRFRTLLLLSFAFITFVSVANAQVPAASAQATPLKVGIINSDAFASSTTGITRLVAALRTLETEFKPRQDEIKTLMGRLDALQKQPTANVPPQQLAARQEQGQSLQIEIRRKQEDARVAYGKRFSTLTDSIRLSIFNALEAYVKARGIDLLIDQAKFPDGVLLVNKSSDLTPGFIKDFNSKNP